MIYDKDTQLFKKGIASKRSLRTSFQGNTSMSTGKVTSRLLYERLKQATSKRNL